MLIDTSVWINVFRDKTGQTRNRLQSLIGENEVILTRFTQLELLQGCRDESEWKLLEPYLQGQTYAEFPSTAWQSAARIYFDLRRRGLAVRSSIDCCIAQVAIDFETISQVCPLQQSRFN
jgi:predicted nucleic acid-binding protein